MRVDHVQEVPEAVVITRDEFEADWKRGYAAVVFLPEEKFYLRDRVTGKQIVRTREAALSYRCMRCQFDSVNEDLIREHIFHGQHPWGFTAFVNPYGHALLNPIEGIEFYSQFLADQKEME